MEVMSKMKIKSIAFGMILIFAVVSPAASAAVLFEDDFNGNNLDGWGNGSGGEVTTSNTPPTYDSYYAKMTGESGKKVWTKRTKIDTGGYENIQFSCYIRTNFQLSAGDTQDKFVVYWRNTSGSFECLETITGDSEWTYWEWDLPPGAGDKNDIRIKFEMHNCEATDFACVDDVLVTGTPTGSPIPISAVDVGGHKIRFVSHTTDIGENSIWTYTVTTGCNPSLSHWSIAWCGKADDIMEVSEKWEYHTDIYDGVDITGIKFDKGYECDEHTGTPETRTVWFKLKGDWHKGSVLVGTKAGHNDEATGYVTGPVCTDPGIPEFSTIAIPVVALLGLFAFYRRKQKK
jgi:hypothetical protein